MPGYRGHVVGALVIWGVGLYIVQSYSQGSIEAGSWLISCIAGALFPDVDITSKGRFYFYRLMTLFLVWCAMYSRLDLFIGGALFALLPQLVKHRGVFHEPWFICAVALLWWLVVGTMMPSWQKEAGWCAGFFVAGAFSHLFLDRGWKGLWR